MPHASRVLCRVQALPGPRRELPRKAVAFALLLLAAGFSCLVAGLALGAQGTANATALFVLGALMFTPVRPHCRLRPRCACPAAVAVGSRLVPRHRVAGAPAARRVSSAAPSFNPAHALSRVSRT